jgi:hypothetical protein
MIYPVLFLAKMIRNLGSCSHKILFVTGKTFMHRGREETYSRENNTIDQNKHKILEDKLKRNINCSRKQIVKTAKMLPKPSESKTNK